MTHDVTERWSAIPGDQSCRAECSCGWSWMFRSAARDGSGWYGVVAIDAITHLRLAGEERTDAQA